MHPETQVETQLAFPAVRGTICTPREDTADNPICTTWAPCPNADDCVCSYYDDEYQCFDEARHSFRLRPSFRLRFGGRPEWRDVLRRGAIDL